MYLLKFHYHNNNKISDGPYIQSSIINSILCEKIDLRGSLNML